MHFVFGDGDACCFECARKEYAGIVRAMRDGYDSSFRIVGADINYETPDLFCAHCNALIPAAYLDDWSVIVGNIGTVYTGNNEEYARDVFAQDYSRTRGDSVTLMRGEDIVSEREI